MSSPNLSLNLGNLEEAPKRRAAYQKAAEKARARNVSEWAKILLDKAAGYAAEKSRS